MKIWGWFKEVPVLVVRSSCLFFALSVSIFSAPDWPRFLGPSNDAKPADGAGTGFGAQLSLIKEWEFEKGKGCATPVVVGESVLVFHRVGSDEVLDCLEAGTGKTKWRYSYSAPYRDRFGASDGVRSSPVVDGGRVFLFGVTGQLHCLDLATGGRSWVRDLKKDYGMKDNFFGHGSSPLILGGKVIVPLGGNSREFVGAFDADSGTELWVARHDWGAGYASPLPVSFRVKNRVREFVLVFAGGETRPPTGGLVCIDALSGEVLGAVPHRARIAESVNAASPVLVGERRVLVTEGYGAGSLLVEISDDGSLSEVWRTVWNACLS